MQAQYGSGFRDDGSGNGYGSRGSGTSYATPYIAGIVALMLEANPDLTPDLAKEVLRFTAERRGDPTLPDLDPFWNRDFGYGIVDTFEACKAAERIDDINAIDVYLQNYIMNISYLEHGSIDIEGFAYAKKGEIEKVELRINEGNWFEVCDTNGTWFDWTYRLNPKDLPLGNNTLQSRAVSGDKHSLISEVDFMVVEHPSEPGAVSEQLMIGALIFLAIIIAAVIIISKYRKKTSG
jgi:hypothetical protein